MKELDITRAKILGVLIRDARLHAGRSAADCARIMGIGAAFFEQAERGEQSLSLPQLEALAMYLDVPLSHFWGDAVLGQPLRDDYADFLALRDRMIGAQLRQARLGAERTPAELAAEIGVEEAQIAAYEAGRTAVPYLHLERLARYLGVSVNDFTDASHGPLAEHEQAHQIRQRFESLPPELQAFVTNPTNISYLQTAKRLSEIDIERLRNIAEGILDITF